MRSLNLRHIKLRSGEEYRDEIELELEPFELGGERYLPVPDKVPAELAITKASTGTVLELGFTARLHGPCYRCLGDAVLEVPIAAREYQANNPGGHGRAAHAVSLGRQPRPDGMVARRGRPRATGEDPVPRRLRGPLPDVREEPERGAARARGRALGFPLGGAREPARAALGSPKGSAPSYTPAFGWPSRRKKPPRLAATSAARSTRSRRRA